MKRLLSIFLLAGAVLLSANHARADNSASVVERYNALYAELRAAGMPHETAATIAYKGSVEQDMAIDRLKQLEQGRLPATSEPAPPNSRRLICDKIGNTIICN